eukprot:scaffold121006_cov69-Phaeocystis_antarctica.AAC.5
MFCARARARPLLGHAALAERDPPLPPRRTPVARVGRAHRRRARLARPIGAGSVVDEAGRAPRLPQLDLARPYVEGVLRVVVALLLRPCGAFPVVPLAPAPLLGGRAEAVEADATADAEGERDGEEAGRGRPFARGPPQQAPQLSVEAGVDQACRVGEGATEGQVLARADPLHVADDELQLAVVERCHEVGLLRVVHAPRRAPPHRPLVAPDGRSVDPDHRVVSIDRSAKVGATQAAGTADNRTRGVGAPQRLAQVALVPPESLHTLSLRLAAHPHPKRRRLRKQAARPLGGEKGWRCKPLHHREAAGWLR